MTGSASCTVCPANSQSPSGSIASSSCICHQGFTGPDGGSCTICEANTYKSVTGSASCTACPANSQSPSGSIAQTACVCNAGFVGQLGGPCSACPAHSTSQPQSSALTDCKCLLGYGGAAGGPCTACGFAYYRGSTDSACRQCPPGTTTPLLNATDQKQCKGLPGYVQSLRPRRTVTVTIVLPYSTVQMTDNIQAKMKTGIAAVANGACNGGNSSCTVTEQNVNIIDVQAYSPSATRRLLQDFVQVTYIIEVFSDEDLAELFNFLSLSTINTALQAQGVSMSTYIILMEQNTEDIVYGIPCEPNTYWISGSLLDTCAACPANSQSPSASVSSTACLCQQGYIWNSVSNLCDACPPGTSNNNYNERVCYLWNTTCPADVI